MTEEICASCRGSGTTTAMHGGLGPDDYEVEVSCPKCGGTGVLSPSTRTEYLVVANGRVEARFATEMEANEHYLHHRHQYPGKWSMVIDNTIAISPEVDALIDTMLHGAGIPRCNEWDVLAACARTLEIERDALKEQLKSLTRSTDRRE